MITNNPLPRIVPLTGSQQIPVPLLNCWHLFFLLLPVEQHHFCFKQCTTKGIGSSGWSCMVNANAMNNKGSEKSSVDEMVAHDKKLEKNSLSQFNKYQKFEIHTSYIPFL
jgi:hypothetical protein